MFRNYLTVALRNLFKQKAASCVNIGVYRSQSRAACLCSCFILDELQFDRFHAHDGRIYRVLFENHQTGERGAIMPAVLFPPC